MNRKLSLLLPLLIALVVVTVFAGCAGNKQEEIDAAREAAIQDSIAQARAMEMERQRLEQARQDSIRAAEEAERLRLEEERRAQMEAERAAKNSLKAVYFAFDKSNLDEAARSALQFNAELMKQYGNWSIVIEGHCDERGSTEYNLALGERRASSVMKYYSDYGIAADRMEMISYGEERPAVQGSNEQAWSQNRRAMTVAK